MKLTQEMHGSIVCYLFLEYFKLGYFNIKIKMKEEGFTNWTLTKH